MSITAGIKVIGMVPMPIGFALVQGRGPMWLQNGNEIGVVGSRSGSVEVLGFSGKGWGTSRVLAAESGDQAAEEGAILDVAPSPDGLTLAAAVVPKGQRRIDVILRELISSGPGQSIASFDGTFDSATMAWVNNTTIAVALRAHPGQPPLPPPESSDPSEPPRKLADGLQIIVVSGQGSAMGVKLDCPMSPLSWSPRAQFAVAQGDETTPAYIIDRQGASCHKMIAPGPIKVLGWEHGSDTTFIYVGPDSSKHAIGVFKFDIASNKGSIIAVSSAAAAYTSSGALLAAGNQQLTFRMVMENPSLPFLAELAIQDPQQGLTLLRPLGFTTVPEMMAQSTMTLARASDEAALEVYAPGSPVPIRKILTYVVPRDNAFLVAQGPARGIAMMSWSLRGRWLAILDGDGAKSTLCVIQPPV